MSCMHVRLSQGVFQVVYPLALWSQSSGVVAVLIRYGWYIIYIHTYVYVYIIGARHAPTPARALTPPCHVCRSQAHTPLQSNIMHH